MNMNYQIILKIKTILTIALVLVVALLIINVVIYAYSNDMFSLLYIFVPEGILFVYILYRLSKYIAKKHEENSPYKKDLPHVPGEIPDWLKEDNNSEEKI